MGLVGEGAIVTSVLSDVFPVIDVENMQTDGWRLAGWRTAIGGESPAPGGGLNAAVALENITTTGTIAVIEQVIIATGGNSTIQLAVNTAGSALAGVSSGFRSFRDLRPPFNPPLPTLSVTESDTLPAGTRVGRFVLAIRTPFIWEPPKGLGVLGPGSMFIVDCITADTTLHVTFLWRERAIEPSETAP